jgi:hypothetical protein
MCCSTSWNAPLPATFSGVTYKSFMLGRRFRSSAMTAFPWMGLCCELRYVAGMPFSSTRARTWSWMRESRGETTIVTPGERTAGSCRERVAF